MQIRFTPFFSIICSAVLFLSFFRDKFVGTDASNNYEAFMNIYKDPSFSSYEPGYLLIVRLVQTVSTNYQVFLIVCSCLILIPLFYVIKDFPYRSLILLWFVLGAYNATFDVLKGFIAFSVFVWGAYWVIYKNKKIGFILMAVSVCIHATMICFWLLGVVSYLLKKKLSYIAIVLVSMFVAIPVIHEEALYAVINIAGQISTRFLKYREMVGDNYVSPTYILFYFSALLVCMIYYRRLVQKDARNRILFNMVFFMSLMTVCFTWVPIIARFFKLSMLFTYLIEAKCVECEKNVYNKTILLLGITLINLLFSFLNNGEFVYKFMW